MKINFAKINLASAETILNWSNKLTRKISSKIPFHIANNYRCFLKELLQTPGSFEYFYIGNISTDKIITRNSEVGLIYAKNGLFSESIFGPTLDFMCNCKESFPSPELFFNDCPACNVTFTFSTVRRYSMGYINLFIPCFHPWYFLGKPSYISTILKIKNEKLKKLIYFNFSFTEYSELFSIYNKIDEIHKQVEEIKLREKLSLGLLSLLRNKKEDLIEKEYEFRDELKTYGQKFILKNKLSKYLTVNNLLKKKKLIKTKIFITEVILNLLNSLDLFKEVSLARKYIALQSSIGDDNELNLRRLRILENLIYTKTNPSSMLITKLPVTPPTLRPYEEIDSDTSETAEINLLYQKIIRTNNTIFLLNSSDLEGKEVLILSQVRILQEYIDFLIDFNKTSYSVINNKPNQSLASFIKGKFGRFRQHILGKRVNFSARAVISVNPQLQINQCGIPIKIMLRLLENHVKNIFYNILSEKKLDFCNIDSELIFNNKDSISFLEKLMKKKIVLLNRAPTLHRLGVQAFQPYIINGNSLQVHPLICTAYNADFDGDQMSIHLPLSPLSIVEMFKLMQSSSNLLLFSNNSLKLKPSQDLILGLLYLTIKNEYSKSFSFGNYFNNFEEFLAYFSSKKLNIHSPLWLELKSDDLDTNFNNTKTCQIDKNNNKFYLRTTPGRLLFNNILNKLK